MAEMLSGLEVEAGLGRVSSSFSGLPGVNGDAADRVKRLKQRFLYCWNHPIWVKWRKESKEDFDFNSGVGQWREEERRKLESESRACLTINEIRPVIEIITGYEKSSRLEVRPVPEGAEDLEDINVMHRVMKRVAQDQEAEFTLSDQFKDGVIGGLGVVYVGVDYLDDPVHGRVLIHKCRPGEVVWDPDWQRYDLSDARDVYWHKMVAVDIIKATYPEQAEEIEKALELLKSSDPGRTHMIPSLDPKDAYKTTSIEAVQFYDWMRDEVRVIEGWYRTWEPVWLLADKVRNSIDEIDPPTPEMLKFARDLAATDPENIKVIRRLRRRLQMTVFLPVIDLELEQGNPFENDEEEYPFVPFLGYWEGDEIFGLVRNLKDPQREVNKRRSSVIDNIVRFGNLRWLAMRTDLENPEFLTEGAGAGNVGWRKNPNSKPEVVEVPQMPQWVMAQDQISKQEIREISLVNAPLQGQPSQAQSGIAIARLQQQGQVGSTGLFDNYRRSRRIFGKRLAKRVQQIYTSEMTLRLDEESGGTAFVTINQRKIDEKRGRVTVERDIPSLKYDMTISDSPSTPTARAAGLVMLMELLDKVPQLAPALVDIIIELTDIPDRQRVLQRVRQIMQGQQGPEAPPAPGGGGTPGAPSKLVQAATPEAVDAVQDQATSRAGLLGGLAT